MYIIRSKQILNQLMREAMYQDEENPISLPKSMLFCEGIGWPTFRITIEKVDEDIYIDGKGDVWKKVKD